MYKSVYSLHLVLKNFREPFVLDGAHLSRMERFVIGTFDSSKKIFPSQTSDDSSVRINTIPFPSLALHGNQDEGLKQTVIHIIAVQRMPCAMLVYFLASEERKVACGEQASPCQISTLVDFMLDHREVAAERLCGMRERESLATWWTTCWITGELQLGASVG
uniref:Uncharacterized protein n=1 Tax=Timema cristinae TaxID=61476 RepID=A0A7R9DRH0_TIMCR|nr:unnamed protein product [Timema cristinae]